MPSAHETAYPRLKSNPSPTELAAVYTPTKEEAALADSVARGEVARLGFLVLLKAFQRLGYFLQLRDVPAAIIEHIAHTQGFLIAPGGLGVYDESGTRRRHVAVIRAHQRVRPFDTDGQVALGKAVREAAQQKRTSPTSSMLLSRSWSGKLSNYRDSRLFKKKHSGGALRSIADSTFRSSPP